MRTKYDWSEVPDEVNFLVTDSDKTVTGWTCEPKRKQLTGTFDRSDWSKTNLGFMRVEPYRGYWGNSLEERPK